MKNLTGSEKQIAWAEEIRARNVNYLKEEISNLNRRILEEGSRFQELVGHLEKALTQLQKEAPAESTWWIKNSGIALKYIQHEKNLASQKK